MRQSAAYDRDMADILPTIAQEFPILKKSKYLRNKLENINVNKYYYIIGSMKPILTGAYLMQSS